MTRRRGYLPGGVGEAVRGLGRIRGFTLIDYPSGKYGFAGRVPAELSYRRKDGQPMTDEEMNNIRQFGPGLFKKTIESVVYDSAETAIEAARELGYEPDNAKDYE